METQGFPRETDWSGDDHKAARQEAAPYQIEFRVLVVVRSLDLQGTILLGK